MKLGKSNKISKLAAMLLLLSACAGIKESSSILQIESSEKKQNDSILKTASQSSVNNFQKEKETIFSGFTEEFSTKPDPKNRFAPFHKSFKKDNISGNYGFNPNDGFYINIYGQERKNTVLEKTKDSISTKQSSLKVANYSQSDWRSSASESIKKTKGWGFFRWLQLWALIVVVALVIWKLGRLILKIPFISRIIKKITT